MTSSSFLQLVFAMREAQRTYFKERTQSALKESKRLEREVDAVLEFLSVQTGTQLSMPLESERKP